MVQDWSTRTRDAIRSMEAGDARGAVAASHGLAGALWDRSVTEARADGLLKAFRGLLGRRGYFVGSDDEFSRSLDEIHALGEGFDLYDLAHELASVDLISTQCLALARGPLFPPLERFAGRCPCGRHPARSV